MDERCKLNVLPYGPQATIWLASSVIQSGMAVDESGKMFEIKFDVALLFPLCPAGRVVINGAEFLAVNINRDLCSSTSARYDVMYTVLRTLGPYIVTKFAH